MANRTRKKQKPQRRPPASHLLIIECEPDKLAQQRLNFGSAAASLLVTLFPTKKIVLVHGTSVGALGQALADAVKANDRFRTVLIVGHSNEEGLQLTPQEFFSWQAVANWVAPFQPEFLLLAACRAGRSAAIRNLFEGVSSLKEIYASPVKFFSDQTHPFAGLLLAVLKYRKIDEAVARLLQASGYAFNDGLIYRWRRRDMRHPNQLNRLGWDLLGDIFNRRQ